MEAQDRSCSLVYIYFSGATVRALLAQRVVVRSARNGNRVEDAASFGRGRSRLERRKTYELTLGATAPTSLYEGWGLHTAPHRVTPRRRPRLRQPPRPPLRAQSARASFPETDPLLWHAHPIAEGIAVKINHLAIDAHGFRIRQPGDRSCTCTGAEDSADTSSLTRRCQWTNKWTNIAYLNADRAL